MARRRIVLLHPTLFADVLRGWPRDVKSDPGVWVESDVPADLRIVGCGWDEMRGTIRLAVESETFDDVPDGVFCPEWEPVYTRHFDPMTAYEAAMTILRSGQSAP